MLSSSSITIAFAHLAFATMLAIATSACGGHVAAIDDAGADASNDATTDGASDSPAVDCKQLQADLDAARVQARTCCPFCNSLQCGHAVDDVCCKISITADSAPAFTSLVTQWKASCATPADCAGVRCGKAPSSVCDPTDPQNPQSRGLCR